MPGGLDIDRQHDLNGTMAAYRRHVLVFTGQSDWISRVEEDGNGTAWGDFYRKLKAMTTRGGEYADPTNNIMVTATSFQATAPSSTTATSAVVFPDGIFLRDIPTNDVEDTSLRSFIETVLIPKSNKQEQGVQRQDRPPSSIGPTFATLANPTILICGHGGRDSRCGIIGPLLKTTFENTLSRLYPRQRLHPLTSDSHDLFDPNEYSVGIISHVGGHKFAGNIIIYVPPGYRIRQGGSSTDPQEVSGGAQAGEEHPLAGKGIWYGRVEPRHVEGIVKETIGNGNIITELFRGGVGADGEILRLPIEGVRLRARKR